MTTMPPTTSPRPSKSASPRRMFPPMTTSATCRARFPAPRPTHQEPSMPQEIQLGKMPNVGTCVPRVQGTCHWVREGAWRMIMLAPATGHARHVTNTGQTLPITGKPIGGSVASPRQVQACTHSNGHADGARPEKHRRKQATSESARARIDELLSSASHRQEHLRGRMSRPIRSMRRSSDLVVMSDPLQSPRDRPVLRMFRLLEYPIPGAPAPAA